MTDMRSSILPRSDQQNFEDFLSGPKTITITAVKGTGNGDQPIAVYFDGDDGRPLKPCKTVRRIMVSLWGYEGSAYVGRSMTLYGDPKVMFGGIAVGGIRVSHMSHIEKETTLALASTKGKRGMHVIKPLRNSQEAPKQQQATQTAQTPTKPLSERLTSFKAYLLARPDSTAMQTAYASKAAKDLFAEVDKADPDVIGTNLPDLDRWVQDQISERQADEKAKTETPTAPADEPDFT